METEGRVVVARGWREGGRDGELVFNGCRVSFWHNEKVLEVDSEDGCTVM